ncbi:hypothetical protein EYF80_013230 [Liparis tanakae]|uniref:Uncharacterized protein n=1 Tax=Liparis tanakae TaxID=230148 RepID=A0A4Z2IFA1_9TELE|nr:hypothetical protein EYF80_013230 [Liparis tanakae]
MVGSEKKDSCSGASVHVGADLCEDGGLVEHVAALARAEAHRAVDGPGAIGVLATQGPTRPAVTPSPPAQTILSVARTLHQSGREQVSWPTTGRRACCRTSAGPPLAAES